MKILVITSGYVPKINGAIRVVREMSLGLCGKGHDVNVLTKWYLKQPRKHRDGCIKITRVGYRRGFGERLIFAILLIFNTVRISRRERSQVIHAHGTLSGLAAMITKATARVPFVLSLHQDALLGWQTGDGTVARIRNQLNRSLQQLISRQANVIIAQSESVGEIFGLVLRVRNTQKFAIVPNPVDHKAFQSQKNVHSDAHSSPRILFVGNLIKRKGVDVLLRGMPIILKIFPSAQLMVIGDGPELQNLLTLSKDLGISRNVQFLGEVSQDQLISAYEKSSVVVLPSYSEVFGVVLIEAMSMNKPVVATATLGAASVVQNEITGLLVRIGNFQGLADAIIRVHANTSEARAMVERARVAVESTFSSEVVVGKLEGIYRKLIFSSVTHNESRSLDLDLEPSYRIY